MGSYTLTNFADIFYPGPIDTLGNLTAFSSVDGTCSGEVPVPYEIAIIAAANETDALTKCVALTGFAAPTSSVTDLGAPDVFVPSERGFWLCLAAHN